MFISKSFKELFFKCFLFESGCKGKDYFSNHQNFFEVFLKKVSSRKPEGSNPQLCLIISWLPRFSLESGCKSTALQHIHQTLPALFLQFFAITNLKRWFSKHAVEHKKKVNSLPGNASYLNIYTRARKHDTPIRKPIKISVRISLTSFYLITWRLQWSYHMKLPQRKENIELATVKLCFMHRKTMSYTEELNLSVFSCFQ